MMTVSTAQVLGIWDELVACYYKNNKYGSDVCEIYTQRLMPCSFGFAKNPESEMYADDVRQANKCLHTICMMFAEKYKCNVTFEDGMSIEALLGEDEQKGGTEPQFRVEDRSDQWWRCHLLVTKESA